MVVLRADPWLPDYGMGFEVAVEEEAGAVDPFVESADWTHGRPGAPRGGELWFVDGVRRVEVRVDASDGERHAPGLFGSYAVGAVCSNGSARFCGHRVRRAVVVGGRLGAERIVVRDLVFEPECEASTDPDAPLVRLQRLMRSAEAELAQETAERGGRLVLADGPLALNSYESPTESPDRVTGSLPLYAGRPWDARTPQNVVPIAALEQWLRHRMGDTRLIRRALMDHLAAEAA